MKRVKKSIYFVDPGGFSLPYDFKYIAVLSRHFNVIFIVSCPNSQVGYLDAIGNLPNVQTINFPNAGHLVSKAICLIKQYWLLLRHRRFIDYVHFNWHGAALTALFVTLFFPNRNLFTVHNVHAHNRSSWSDLVDKLNYRSFSKLVLVSKHNATLFTKNFPSLSHNPVSASISCSS